MRKEPVVVFTTLLACLLIYLAGMLTTINLASMGYGHPDKYPGSWLKVILSITIATAWTGILLKADD
jgi:hypothetical protein